MAQDATGPLYQSAFHDFLKRRNAPPPLDHINIIWLMSVCEIVTYTRSMAHHVLQLCIHGLERCRGHQYQWAWPSLQQYQHLSPRSGCLWCSNGLPSRAAADACRRQSDDAECIRHVRTGDSHTLWAGGIAPHIPLSAPSSLGHAFHRLRIAFNRNVKGGGSGSLKGWHSSDEIKVVAAVGARRSCPLYDE